MLDSGQIVINYGEASPITLGAIRGGATFTVEQDIRDIEVDGSPGPVKSLRRIIAVRPMLTFTLVEFGVENLKRLLPASASTNLSGGNHTRITRATQEIADSAYFANVSLLGQVSGKNQAGVFTVLNALFTANMSITTQDDNEGTMQCEALGHFDPANLDNEPWRIDWARV